MSWDLKIKIAGPKAELIKSYCKIWIGGDVKPPGTYSVKKGTKIKYRGGVKNAGDIKGNIRVSLVDALTGEIIGYKDGVLPPGGWFKMTDSFTFGEKRDLAFKGKHKAGPRNWPTDDTYGD